MSCSRFTTDEYAFYALGTLDGEDRELLRLHLSENCSTCVPELKDALRFWLVFAALTEKTQGCLFPKPSPMLRERVLDIARPHGARRRNQMLSGNQTWMRIAAGILLTAGAATLSWDIGHSQMKRDISEARVRVEQQTSAVKKLESENNALRNLVAAARNAPAVFPGRDSIVSVQDPYLLRDLQQARQTQVAISQALNEERARTADLGKRLSQTAVLLAAATQDREAADRQYRKAYEAATMEKERGENQLSTEISAYKARVQDLVTQIARYRTVIDAQNKGLEQSLQMISLLQSSSVALVPLRPTEAGQKASGVALIADNSRLAFFPVNLPAAPTGRTYQLWLIRDKGQPVLSAGTFNSASKDAPAVQFSNTTPLSGIKGFAVTEEPAGGSALPTGHKILTGSK